MGLIAILQNYSLTMNHKTVHPLERDYHQVFYAVKGGVWLNFKRRTDQPGAHSDNLQYITLTKNIFYIIKLIVCSIPSQITFLSKIYVQIYPYFVNKSNAVEIYLCPVYKQRCNRCRPLILANGLYKYTQIKIIRSKIIGFYPSQIRIVFSNKMEVIWVTSITFLLTTLGAIWLFLRNAHSYWKKRGVPHPRPSLLFGNVGSILTTKLLFAQFCNDVYRYICTFINAVSLKLCMSICTS